MVLLLAGDEVEHEHFLYIRANEGPELFVRGMGQVDFSPSFIIESDEKAMGESVRKSFWTVVGSPFVGGDFRNIAWKRGEFRFDFLYLGFAGPLFELEEDNVA